jgi:hypothetical protein
MTWSLGLALLSLAVWITGIWFVPVHAGWIHLFLGAGVLLLVRRIVVGRDAW